MNKMFVLKPIKNNGKQLQSKVGIVANLQIYKKQTQLLRLNQFKNTQFFLYKKQLIFSINRTRTQN